MTDAELEELFNETNAARSEYNRLVVLLKASRGAPRSIIDEILSDARLAKVEADSLTEKYMNELVKRKEAEPNVKEN